jgi:transposase
LPVFVAVGIDSSDQHHDIFAEAPGFPQPLRLRISNDLTGFQRLRDRLGEIFGTLPYRFALENPSLLIARFLLHAGYSVYAVNPRSVAKMREALASSGKKSDPLDAECLCLLLRRRAEDLASVSAGSPSSALLAGLVRQRVDLVEEKNRLLNQLTAVLKAFYPRALQLFKNRLDQPLTLAFLEQFSSPSALAAATEEQWRNLFVGRRYPQPGRITTLWKQVQEPQVPVSAVDEALGERQVRRLVRSLQVLLEELEALQDEILERFDALPEARIFRSLPGAADVLAPALCSLFGDDRERWREWKDVARISGTVPVTKSSGNFRAVSMRHHCDHRARRTLHLFAASSVRACEWARQFFVEQRQKGKTYGAALRNLATKWLRIIFRLWQASDTYEEDRYLQRRAARQAEKPLAAPTRDDADAGTLLSRPGGGRTPSVSSAGAGPASGLLPVGALASAVGGAE